MDRIQEETAEKCGILLLSELSGRSPRSVDKSQNFLSAAVQMSRTFKIYFRFLALIRLTKVS